MRRSSATRSSALGVLLGLPAVALLLAACGGGSGAASGYGAPAGGSGNAASGMASVQQVAAFGPLLEDSKGNTLYYNDQESGGTWKCTADCLGFWFPVPGSANPGNVPGLGTVQRGDNHQQQLTYQGHPLYTFRLDSPGQRMGDNLGDDFASTHFTWHAATTGPVTNPAPPKTLTNGGIAPVGPGGSSMSPGTGGNGYGGGSGGYGGGSGGGGNNGYGGY